MIEVVLLVGIIILAISSQSIINSVYAKYAKTSSSLELTGRDIAEKMLLENGVMGVGFGVTKNDLGDYYDPRSKMIYLSKSGMQSNSVAALAVAAHETGHAIQDSEGYFMLRIRNAIAPVCSFCSRFVWLAILAGVLMQMLNLVIFGLALMGAVIVFQLVTLPVEFDASRRAVNYLSTIVVDEDAMIGVKKMLKAAAYTYVASTLASILQLIRLINRFDGDR